MDEEGNEKSNDRERLDIKISNILEKKKIILYIIQIYTSVKGSIDIAIKEKRLKVFY